MGNYPRHIDKILAGNEYWIRFMLREFHDSDVEPGESYPAREVVLRLAKQHNIVI